MPRKRSRSRGEAAKLEMTPMIDVVFQLLIFFIVTLKPEDILSHLDVSRPAPDPNAKQEEQVKDLLTITVAPDGFFFRGRRVGPKTLERHLGRLASYSQNVSVIIQCMGDSSHSKLVELLNICSKVGLKNLSVFSL